jgi:class 3 adenylate cyclase/tetratricopeptide (TPR) repeat protein
MAACPSCGQENLVGARFCQACAAPLGETAAHEVRKTVTVLFSDIVDSTPLGERLDPESLRRVMSRYFAEMRAALEAHGGTVEKFIGDAVMAVFGVPTLHEDDALRAVRAANEMRERLAALNDDLRRAYGVELEMRVGINTGQVVAGRAGTPTLATGDAVNLAKRLEQAAGSGEILIGTDTYRLVRGLVEAVPLEPRAMKGKADAIATWRLEAVVPPSPALRPRQTPLVGREAELEALVAEFERVAAERSARLVTILGAPGIGKSRLAEELLERIRERTTALRGQCLPYGDGITFWPLVQMMREAGGEVAIREALEGHGDAALIVERTLGATGAAGEAGGGEETSWALRKLFEALGRTRPLVLVFEDIHWGEPTLLDLIEYFAGWIRDAPVLLLCLARPDLLDRQPTWLTPRANASTIPLTPLSPAHTDRLLADTDLGPTVRARIAAAAEGNPFFVEQMVALLAEEGDSGETVLIPPSIHALLAARLDRLTDEERAITETAAVVGRGFWRGAVRDLAPPALRDSVGTHLMALVRKDFVEPEASTLAHEDAFRFRHVLIRDAAYESLPKERRADLHERFANWIGANAPDRAIELEEIVGYHLEQAYRLRTELGPLGADDRVLAARAGDLLASAAGRASARGDTPAAVGFLKRAAALLQGAPKRAEILLELARGLAESGDFTRADKLLREVSEAAAARDDGALAARALVERSQMRVSVERDASIADSLRAVEGTLSTLEQAGDDAALARASWVVAEMRWLRCEFAAAEESLERSLVHAERAGSQREIVRPRTYLALAAIDGPRPVAAALRRCREIIAQAPGDQLLEANVGYAMAYAEAMRGRFDEARVLAARSTAIYEDLGRPFALAAWSAWPGAVELLAGDLKAAERIFRSGYETLVSLGEKLNLSSIAASLAETLYLQGRREESERLTRVSEEATSPDDLWAQVAWRSARSKILARRGEDDEAERLAGEAVELIAPTDALNMRAHALSSLAQVLAAAGRAEGAAERMAEAIRLYEAKGNIAAAGKARAAVATRALKTGAT